MSGGVPIRNCGIERLWGWEKRILQDSGIAGLVEGHDINVVTLVLLDDVLGVIISVEGVHEDEWHIDIISSVEVFDLADGKVQERHAITDFNDRLWSNATHRGTQATIELENSKLVQKTDRLRIC